MRKQKNKCSSGGGGGSGGGCGSCCCSSVKCYHFVISIQLILVSIDNW